MDEQTKGRIKLKVPELLAQRNMTHKDIVWGCHVTDPTARRIALGNAEWITFEILASLCEMFNLPVGEILQYEVDE